MSRSFAQALAEVRWLPIFVEAFLVVFGVVVALWANEWRDQRQRMVQAETALEGIRAEVALNHNALHDALAYHVMITDSLWQIMRRPVPAGTPAPRPSVRLFHKGYVGTATLLSTAWDVAHSTDAVSDMDYDTVLRLSRLYQAQDRYQFQAQETGQLVYAKLFDNGHTSILNNYGNLHTVLLSFVYTECALLRDYQALLTSLAPETASSLAPLPERCASMSGR